MIRLTLAASVAALTLAAPAAAEVRPLPEIPPVHCGIVSCTYPIEKKIEYARESAETCVNNTVAAVENALSGTPQPTTCAI